MAIDLVFDQFIRTKVLQVLNGLQTRNNYTRAVVETYSSILLDQALGIVELNIIRGNGWPK